MAAFLADSSVLLEAALNESGLVWSEIPREALFLAGKAFLAYRKAGEPRTTPLPDFFIGAHAAVSELVLITRDPERVRRHFPDATRANPWKRTKPKVGATWFKEMNDTRFSRARRSAPITGTSGGDGGGPAPV